MDDAGALPDLRVLRERILDRMLRWTAIVGAVPCAAGVALSFQGGVPAVAVLDAAAWGAIAAAAVRPWRYEIRAGVLLAAFGGVGVGVLAALGPFGAGMLWLLALPIAAAVLLGTRAFWLSEGIVAAVLLAVGAAARAGLWWWADPGPLWWVLAGCSVASVSLLVGLSTSVLTAGLERSLQDAAAGRARAIAAHRELETEVAFRRQAERERRQLEEQVVVAQKMELVGQLAGGLVHDLNNVLTVVRVEGSAARAAVPDRSPPAESLERLLVAADSAAALCGRLLAFARKRVGSRVAVRIDAQLAAMAPLLRSLAGERIAVHLALGAPNAEVRAEPGEIEQLVTNLVANARDAQPDGGDVWIETRDQVDAHGPRIRIDVRDAGPGIPPAVLPRLFEPFFTTRPDGTGLGLSTVYALARSLDGTVEVSSPPGAGATFRLLLPRQDAGAREAPPPSEGAAAGPTPGTPRTVLLVEDNAQVRPVVARLLRHFGCRAVAVGSAREALAAVDEVAPDLVLTDVRMPDQTGADLAEALRARQPSLPILAMSGWLGDDELAVRLGRIGVPVLRKPFTPEALGRALAERLAARERGEDALARTPEPS